MATLEACGGPALGHRNTASQLLQGGGWVMTVKPLALQQMASYPQQSTNEWYSGGNIPT